MEPKIRFKGYMFGWVSEAIGLYYNFKNGLNKSKEYFGFGTPIVNFTDVFNNRVLDYASLKGRVFVTKEEIANYSVQKGDLFFTRTSETLEEIGYPSVMLSDSPQTVYSGFVLRGRAINNDPLVDVFKSYVFFTTSFRKEMIRKSSMTTRALTSGNRLKEMIFTYPKAEDEQFKIGNYFLTLDNKIQTTSKKLESLKKLKSASLVAMFPQQGKTTPKVRFKGFEGEWKTPSIGDVFELRNGYTPSKIVKEFWEGGTIPWFRMEDIRMNGGFLKDALQHITPLAVKGAGLFEKNSIILATTATIGVHAMLIADSLANQQFTNFKVRKSLSDEYIDEFIYYSFFKIDEWSKNNTNSGGLLSVNMPLLVKQSFLTPCKEEQQAIATFFRSLDRKIALETARLEKLKQIKLACLDKMFV
mgnify:CR=1 FL=1